MPRALTLTTRCIAACVLFSALLAAPALSVGSDGAARGREKSRSDDEPKRVVKVYLVDDLVLAPSDYPFEANLPTAAPFAQSEGNSRRGLVGGYGGGVGGGAQAAAWVAAWAGDSPSTANREEAGGWLN